MAELPKSNLYVEFHWEKSKWYCVEVALIVSRSFKVSLLISLHSVRAFLHVKLDI